jgi:hypothetical protein
LLRKDTPGREDVMQLLQRRPGGSGQQKEQMVNVKTRVLWGLVVGLTSLVVALVAGILTVVGGATVAAAFIAGGVAFGGTATLLLGFGAAFKIV